MSILTARVDLISLSVGRGEELPSLIFTTAHDEFAVKAIKHAALDYLLKPIDAEELLKAIRKAGQKVSVDRQEVVSEAFQGAPKKLVIPTTEGMHILNVKDIVRCESSSNYTTFYLSDKSHVLASKTMKEYENLFAQQVLSASIKSSCESGNDLWYISADGGYVLLKEGSTVPVSNRKKETLVNHLKRTLDALALCFFTFLRKLSFW